jgi:hypothetical protein
MYHGWSFLSDNEQKEEGMPLLSFPFMIHITQSGRFDQTAGLKKRWSRPETVNWKPAFPCR